MTPIEIHAPGKLFLLGEYIVLFGGPAVLMSVNRYVKARVEPSYSAFQVDSLGLDVPTLTGEWQHNKVLWRRVHPGHTLVTHIVDALCRDRVIHQATPPFKLLIDSQELYEQGKKLGLGSSAAVTHAVSNAIFEYSNECEANDIRRHRLTPEWMFQLHSNFQQGRGSGADVAAGVIGGTYVYSRLPNNLSPNMQAITLPATLHCRTIWVGKPASTPAALERLSTFQRAHPVQFTQSLSPMLEMANAGIDALSVGDAEGFASICQRYCHNLSEFGRTVGIDIVSDAHAQLAKLAVSVGVAYKPSGAGSGDFGIALSTNINGLDDFERLAAKIDCRALNLVPGMRCHRVQLAK